MAVREGGFIGFVPALPGLGVQNETISELIADLLDLIPDFYREYSTTGANELLGINDYLSAAPRSKKN